MGATPRYGWPYPDPASPPDMNYWLKALAEAQEEDLPGPVDITSNAITASAGWTITAGQLFVRRGLVHVYLNTTRTGAAIAGNSNGNIGNVEIGFLADTKYNPLAPVGGATSATGGMASIGLWTNGGISIAALPPNVGIATNDAYSASFVYPMA